MCGCMRWSRTAYCSCRRRQQMLDQSEHMFTCHRGKCLIRDVIVIPSEDPVSSQEQSLAGLGLQTPHLPQVIQISAEQRPVGIGYCMPVRR